MPKVDVEDGLRTRWSRRWSLTGRILAVNIFALALLAGGFFYLDSFRTRVIDARQDMIAMETDVIARAIRTMPTPLRTAYLREAGEATGLRLRFYRPDGTRATDSWQGGTPTYYLRDPKTEPWQRHVARFLDKLVEKVAGSQAYPKFFEPAQDRLQSWPEAMQAVRTGRLHSLIRRAPDRSPVLSTAVPVAGTHPGILLSTINARDVVRSIRAERLRLGIVLAIVIGVSVLLSLFLARTIVRPLQRLAYAAHRVRQGRAREVQVPRLPSRRDEIGMLARAVSDMSLALRHRIDATEAFAADVSHELKNPLASLRSAIDSLAMVKDDALRQQLIDILRDDVVRIDRLITDIADASRLDAELSRARFEPVDIGTMIEGIVHQREQRGLDAEVRLAFARPRAGTAVVMGDGNRLERAIENLVDNAVSFSPPRGLVQIAAMRDGDNVIVRIEDEGPGVPPSAREEIFNRFHSLRPQGEAFGQHSGLGLAIARATVEGHGGLILVKDRENKARGACFLITLPSKDIA